MAGELSEATYAEFKGCLEASDVSRFAILAQHLEVENYETDARQSALLDYYVLLLDEAIRELRLPHAKAAGVLRMGKAALDVRERVRCDTFTLHYSVNYSAV